MKPPAWETGHCLRGRTELKAIIETSEKSRQVGKKIEGAKKTPQDERWHVLPPPSELAWGPGTYLIGVISGVGNLNRECGIIFQA